MNLTLIRFMAYWPTLRTAALTCLWTAQHVTYRLKNPAQKCFFPWWVQFTWSRLRGLHSGNVQAADRLILDWWKEVMS